MSSFDDRILALAGLVQALRQVRQIAETGQADNAVLATATDSVFRVDADTPEAVFGGAQAVAPGMQLLLDYFSKTYVASNFVVVAVGNLEHWRVQDLLERRSRTRRTTARRPITPRPAWRP